MPKTQKPFRIGFFIDGFTLHKVNHYYKYYHKCHSHISFSGLRNFVMKQVKPYCPKNKSLILEGHYYHSRKNPAYDNECPFNTSLERFEEKLLDQGIQMHYPNAPLDWKTSGNSDLINDIKMYAMFQEIDIVVLLSTQGFYAETAKMLREQKIPLILLGWNFSYPKNQKLILWKTDIDLKNYAFQYIAMEKIMDNKNMTSLFEKKPKLLIKPTHKMSYRFQRA